MSTEVVPGCERHPKETVEGCIICFISEVKWRLEHPCIFCGCVIGKGLMEFHVSVCHLAPDGSDEAPG